jgi:eukaryotic-like serine/threonine-protein kinase
MIGETLSHFRIISKIGAGGMGEVYLAEDTRLDRKVALKLLPAQFTKDEDRVRRFEQEARAASALNHPNIITIHDIGRADELHFIATEFIDGQTLRQRMMPARMELNAALDVTLQIATALSAAHEAGIIHRDIKPENVMLRRDGIVKVLDFGLAKLTERRAPVTDTGSPTALNPQTDPGTVMGTAHYMSPEQARGVDVDARSDIFSLGVMFYEMVTGRAPFAGATVTDIIIAIVQQEPAPVTRYAPGAPGELVRIVSKALAKDREERYQTAKDLQIDLKRLRQRLEFEAELERSAQPEAGDAAARTVGQQRVETAKVAAPDTAEAAVRTVSSAEYLVSGIWRHKVAFGALALALVALISMGFYLLGGRGEEKAIESIAVLPFVNTNADPNIEYLADGIPESIINSLSQMPKLKIMSRTSAFRFKGRETDAQEVGRTMGVQAVLTGHVAQRGEALLISIELVSARDNRQIWGQQYNRKLADVFAVQEEIAKEISEKLRLKLTGAEKQQLAKRPTENLKAFQYYMQGRSYTHRRTREDLLTAIRYCEQAIEEDRSYALAYAGLADAYAMLGVRGYIVPSEGRRKAEEAARRALALDENLAEAHAALGLAYEVFAPYNFSLGDRELRRAIELSPSSALAHQYLGFSLLLQGRLDEGLAESLKARELDPLSSINARGVALHYYLKRDYVRALELQRQANELGPPLSTPWEIGTYIQNRLFNEALAESEKAKRERKDDPILIYSTGMVYAAQEKRAEALQVIKELEAMSGANLDEAHWIAKIYAALNEKEMAFAWLERGLAAGAIGAFYKDEPVWDTIRSDGRFGDLLRRMGLPE